MLPINPEGDEESAVRSVIYALVKAVQSNDVEAMLAHCVPDLVMFNMLPPIQHEGAGAIRRLWAKELGGFVPPLEYEVHQLDITVGGAVAFARCLNRFVGRRKDGKRSSSWLRSTLGLRKLEGRWKVLHEHVSVPFDSETGKPLLELKPS